MTDPLTFLIDIKSLQDWAKTMKPLGQGKSKEELEFQRFIDRAMGESK